MPLVGIKTYNFRNLNNDNVLNFNAKEIFLIGRNGQGKTNLIESVYIISFGSSFRTRLYNRFITRGKDSSYIFGSFVFYDDRGNAVSTRETEIKIKKPGTKKIYVDKKIIRDRSELIENFPCIIFSHEDIDLVVGYQDKRRRFFDQTISLYDKVYLKMLREYYRVLKNRNLILAENKISLLDIYNKQLVSLGREIQCRRHKTVEEFNKVFFKVLSNITDDLSGLVIEYRPSWDIDASETEIISYVETKLGKEMMYGFSITGPHKDTFLFNLRGNNFAHYASTGQLRLCSLALKAAQSQYVYSIVKRKPILLLDDVLLEMDKEKKISFLQSLPLYDQAFFTFLPDEDFLSYTGDHTEIYSVENGNIDLWKKQVTY